MGYVATVLGCRANRGWIHFSCVTSEAGRASSLPGMAPPAPNGAIPMGVRSFPRHALRDLPVAVSLAALAAVALPAVGGLVILTLAVVRVGYRQEKADFALRTAGSRASPGAAQGRAQRAVYGRTRDHRGGVLPRLASRPAALNLCAASAIQFTTS